MTERLTSLAAVKEWLGITTDNSDTQLIRLIDAASQFILGWLNRDSFQVRTYTQNFRGNGKNTMLLRNWPILSVTSVGMAGQSIGPASSPVNGLPGSGYMISDPRDAPQSIDLFGYDFYYRAPGQIVYVAGFRSSQTTAIPDDPYQITPNAGGQWSANISVTIDGTDAILVSENPSAGEYMVDEWGTYTFAAADTTKIAVMTYDYVPWSVSFAVTQLIGEWYRRKDRIGVLSKTLGGQETITFSQRDMTDSIQGSLQIYQNVVPV